ncbi:CAP domain-containing protein [Rubrobacter calidifluminis]|uniref:CAP domain-containing protein n=1 Tax=Rubrobacter calidifluminis TaxID=1392640 RepID=UPI0023610740|nr:CAP domain-containing protein [Rubrobacter calidifluminis]
MRSRLATYVLLAVLVLVFSTPVVAPAAGAQASPQRPGAYIKGCGKLRIYLTAREKTIYYAQNQVRESHGLKPLCLNNKLVKAAYQHATKMTRYDRLWHGNVGRRLHEFGYDWKIYGENIGVKHFDPDDMFHAWMRSKRDRGNILNPKFTQVGVGVQYGVYKGVRQPVYCVDFATPR